MWKRWIIRGILLGLLVLNIGAWLWSSSNIGKIAYEQAHYMAIVGTESGYFIFIYGSHSPGHSGSVGWTYAVRHTETIRFWPREAAGAYLGFRYLLEDGARFIQIPYWFLILLCSVILFWVWRKTGKKGSAGAFPVVVRESHE